MRDLLVGGLVGVAFLTGIHLLIRVYDWLSRELG
jgi:hypothetical protein